MVTTDAPEKKGDLKLAPENKDTPKGDQPVSYTQEELDKAVRNTRSAALADITRLRKASEDAIKQAQAANVRLDRMMKEQEEAELQGAKDQPDVLTTIRERQARRKAEDELAQARQELNEKDERLNVIETEKAEVTRNQTASAIATRLGVDPQRLTKLAKFTDGTPEAIEELAEELPKVNSENPQNRGFKPDSNRSRGGSSQTVNDVRTDYTQGKINAVQYAEKMKALGVSP